MTNSTWGDLINSMPDEPAEEVSDSPVRNYELLLQAMHEVVNALQSKPPAEDVVALLETGIERLMDTAGAIDSTLFVLDEQSHELNFVIVKGSIPEEKLKWRKLARGYGIAGWVAENATHVVANDIEYDSRFCIWFDDELEFKTKTVLAVPVVYDERVLGVVELINKRGKGLFTNADLAATSVFANLTGQVLDDLTSRGEKTHA